MATWLYGTYDSPFAIAGYIAMCSFITLITVSMMTDYAGKDIEDEPPVQRQ